MGRCLSASTALWREVRLGTGSADLRNRNPRNRELATCLRHLFAHQCILGKRRRDLLYRLQH
jgi:hypothetical protein